MRTPTLALLAGLILAAPAPARASDWRLSPFVGGTGGGDATHSSPAVGVSGGWMGASLLGAEGELGDTPAFFKQNGFLTERRVTTIMGNVIVGIPRVKTDMFRPYVAGGLGVLRLKLSEPGGIFALDRNKFGMDVGGGAMAFFNPRLGIRGDVRYFRGLRTQDADRNDFGLDLSSFHFWRVSAGLAVRF